MFFIYKFNKDINSLLTVLLHFAIFLLRFFFCFSDIFTGRKKRLNDRFAVHLLSNCFVCKFIINALISINNLIIASAWTLTQTRQV